MARRTSALSRELTEQQRAAIERLLAGETMDSTAAAVGISRETLAEWRQEDPLFIARYNESLQSTWEASQTKLMEARAKAIGKLAELVDDDDTGIALKAAAALVRINIPKPTGGTSLQGVLREIEWRNAFRI